MFTPPLPMFMGISGVESKVVSWIRMDKAFGHYD